MLKRAGFDTLLLETRHVACTGRNQPIRINWASPRASLRSVFTIIADNAAFLSIRGILRGFGLKVGVVTRKGFEGRIRELVTGHITLERIAGAMLSARATLKVEYEKLHKTVLTIVREDAVCRSHSPLCPDNLR